MKDLIREEVMNAIGDHPNKFLIDSLLETEQTAMCLLWTYEMWCSQLERNEEPPTRQAWEEMTMRGFPIATKQAIDMMALSLVWLKQKHHHVFFMKAPVTGG